MRRRDPGFDALRRALRPAIVVPVGAAIALQVGGVQTPLFTIFGSFALLVLVDFPGTRGRRAVSYTVLAVVGYAFISAATFLAKPGWLGALSMLVVGVVVSYAAILSSSFSAAQRAALLLFVLPVASPSGPLSDRLLGWTLALVFSVPAALFLLPPRHHDELRERARDVCAGLAGYLDSRSAEAHPDDIAAAMDRLRQIYLGTDTRPSGLTAGSRALIRVVDDLEWLTSQVSNPQPPLPDAMREHAVDVLRRSVDVLTTDTAASRAALNDAVAALTSLLQNRFGAHIELIVADESEVDAESTGMRLLSAHTVCSTIALVGRTVAWASAADARPMVSKILGGQLPPTGVADLVLSEYAATRMSVSSTVIKNSVIARNALRTGFGLAAAVALIHVVPVQHGFWVVLGAMSVLRTSALTTGSNVARAVLGTAAGFVLGALIVTALGTNEVALWIALPVAAFGAAYIPKVISFAAGQAAFTVLVITLFNVLDPDRVADRIGQGRGHRDRMRGRGRRVGGDVAARCGDHGAGSDRHSPRRVPALPDCGHRQDHRRLHARRRGRCRRPAETRPAGLPGSRRRCAPIPFRDRNCCREADAGRAGREPGQPIARCRRFDRRPRPHREPWSHRPPTVCGDRCPCLPYRRGGG